MTIERELREAVLKRAREYAQVRWPDVPVEARLDPTGENVVFAYSVETVVGRVSVDSLMVKEALL